MTNPLISCLASRIPWGQRVTAEKLARIELSEKIIKQKIGVQQVRVRDINGLARIEVELDKLSLLNDSEIKNEIFSKLKMIGFSEVEINPNGYVSGSLNVILEN
jgi:ATP-utilizing enzymes of the PP-loop superfamily